MVDRDHAFRVASAVSAVIGCDLLGEGGHWRAAGAQAGAGHSMQHVLKSNGVRDCCCQSSRRSGYFSKLLTSITRPITRPATTVAPPATRAVAADCSFAPLVKVSSTTSTLRPPASAVG